ncbi:MAG: MarR family transcriptional regulator [Bacteroidales bacterium]|nr:MarR family transcriptional regulator [Bacteroidales bacterium]
MTSSYSILKQIIDFLVAYEEEVPQQKDLLSFAEWIVSRIKEEPALNRRYITKKLFSEYSEHFDYIKSLDEKARFLECISRIARFHEFYIRKFLEELPVNGRLEFMFLLTVNIMDKAKKTDLINIHMVEYTTGMDTIRRLINNGLLEEMPDENDKRARLLVLTPKGKSILLKSSSKMTDERNMFLACISSNKWKKTLPVLEEINEFHNAIYMNHYDKPPAELLNLMDSLKYLYK